MEVDTNGSHYTVANMILQALPEFASSETPLRCPTSFQWKSHRISLGHTEKRQIILGFEVLAAVVMKRIIFWDITPCSPLKVNRSFGGIYRIHFQNRMSRARYQRESRWQVDSTLRQIYCLYFTDLHCHRFEERHRQLLTRSGFFISDSPIIFSISLCTTGSLWHIAELWEWKPWRSVSKSAGTLWTVLATSLMNELSSVEQYVLLLESLYTSIYVIIWVVYYTCVMLFEDVHLWMFDRLLFPQPCCFSCSLVQFLFQMINEAVYFFACIWLEYHWPMERSPS
jgi:hypothetical protein